jgi:UDP-GlcNAc:undecaprenyl-phosphate GlcNAc-1-phosphate transferase
MTPFTGFFIALIGSMLLVPLLIRLSGPLHLMDLPDARKVHMASIPRSGGVAIVAGAAIPIAIWLPADPVLFGVLAGGFILAVFGFIDDRVNLNYRWKFLGQLLAVGCALAGGLRIHEAPFFGIHAVPDLISYPLTVLFLLGVTNAINFSDGLDGLAGGISLLTLSAIAWLSYQAGGVELTLTALALMGGICGFLRYNNYPAVVFMGDTGSQFLGFMTGALALMLTQKVSPTLNPAIVLLLLGLPILDTLTVMTWRIRRGESPFLPDRNHFHHRLLEFGFFQYEAVSLIYFTHGLFVLSAILLKYESDLLIIGICVVFSLCVAGLFRWARVTNWRIHRTTPEGVFVERRNRLLRRLTWLPELSARATEYAFGVFLVASAFAPVQVDRVFGAIALGAASVFAFAYLVRETAGNNLRRIGVYLAAVCAVYALAAPEQAAWVPTWAANAFIVVLGAILVVAIRVTRREQFRTTPLDLLILFFVIVSLVLTQAGEGPFAHYDNLGDAVIRLAVLFYAGEFLYSKGARYQSGLSLLACAALVLLGARGFGVLP